MVHLHARDPQTGKPSQDPKLFAQFLSRIKEQSDAIINITTGGGLGMTLDQRLAPALWAKPEIASMNMGSLNFNISGAAGKIREFKFDWEKPYLEMTKDFILSNTFAQIERGLRKWVITGRASSLNAMTSGICITSPTSRIASSPSRRFSFRPFSEFWAEWGRIRKTCCM